MLFVLKITVTPLLVAFVALATRWWGPTVGGILAGLPWFTGPMLFILVQEHGSGFGEAACVGAQLGVVCISAFMLAYALVAAAANWPVSLAAAVAAFFAAAALVAQPGLMAWLAAGPLPPLWIAAGLGAASLCVVLAAVPRPSRDILAQAPPWWDIPARIATAAALVASIVLSAEALGPRLAGVFSTYPIVLTVTGTFTHHRWGHDAVWRVLRGLAASLFGFQAFFLVAGEALPSTGLVGAYALAIAAALAITSLLLALHRFSDAKRKASLAQGLRRAP